MIPTRQLWTGVVLLAFGILLLTAGIVHDILATLVYVSAAVAAIAGILILVGRNPARQTFGIVLLVGGLLLLLLPQLAAAIATLAAVAAGIVLVVAGIVVLVRKGS